MTTRVLKIAMVVAFVAAPIRVSATTVVVIIAKNGMVLSSDSMTTTSGGNYSTTGAFDQAKFVTIQRRIVVAAIGVSAIKDASHQFNFLTWMGDLQGRIPKDASVDDVVSIVEEESAAIFSKLNLDAYLKNGTMKRPHYSNACEKFTEFVIAGYQDGKPRLYSVEFDVDWNSKTMSGPVQTLQNPDSEPADYRVVYFGDHEALVDFADRKSYAHKVAAEFCPEVIKKIDDRTALPSLYETVELSRAFIQVEENTNPGSVGGAIKSIMWLPDGHAAEWSEHENASDK